MKGKRVRIGCAAASLLMGISGTYAYYRSSVETINKIAVGDVNIGIWEYEEDGDGEKKYEGPENGIVLPSQVISKIPRITNYAEPCYVRVKPVFDEEETQDYRLGEEDLGGIEDVWLKAGEYYYYPKVLGKQESVDFFRTITIPSAWTSEAEGQVLSVEIQAEAVQAANVTPDFTAEAPWGEELEIEQCVHEADNTVSEVSQQSFLTVSYEGAARNLILAPDNFFRNFPVLMPGDEWEDTFTLVNTTASRAEFFLRTELPEELSETKTLLKESITAMALPDHPLFAERDTLSLTELAEQPLILSNRYRKYMLSAFEQAGLFCDIYLTCEDARTAMTMAEKGLGIALLPASMLPLSHQLKACAITDADLTTEILLAWRKGRLPSELRDFL